MAAGGGHGPRAGARATLGGRGFRWRDVRLFGWIGAGRRRRQATAPEVPCRAVLAAADRSRARLAGEFLVELPPGARRGALPPWWTAESVRFAVGRQGAVLGATWMFAIFFGVRHEGDGSINGMFAVVQPWRKKTINETVLRIRFPAPVRRATLGVVAQKLAWTKSHSRDGEHSGRRSSNCHSSRVRRHGQRDDRRMWFGLFGSCVDLDGAGRIGCAHHSAQPHRLDWTPQPGQGGGWLAPALTPVLCVYRSARCTPGRWLLSPAYGGCPLGHGRAAWATLLCRLLLCSVVSASRRIANVPCLPLCLCWVLSTRAHPSSLLV